MGKGCIRRPEDAKAVRDNWPFGRPKQQKKCPECGGVMEFIDGFWKGHGAYVCGCGNEERENG